MNQTSALCQLIDLFWVGQKANILKYSGASAYIRTPEKSNSYMVQIKGSVHPNYKNSCPASPHDFGFISTSAYT